MLFITRGLSAMQKINAQSQLEKILSSDFMKKFLWLRQNFAYCLGISTLVWFVGLGYYIDNFIGWSSILTLKPSDFSLLLIGTFLPILLLWFILAYIERSSSIDANAKLFSAYINALIYPDSNTSRDIKALANILKNQTELLQKENKNVVEQSAKVKIDLDAKVADLAKILKLLDEYSGKTLLELNDGVKILADKCSYITDKTTNSVNNMSECSADIQQNADLFLSKINPLLDEISAVSSNIKNNISGNKDNLLQIKSDLTECATISQHHIDNMLARSSDNMKHIQQAFYKTAEECDVLYKKMDSSISSIEGRVDEQKRLVGKQSQVLDHNSELLNNKLMKYGKAVSAEIDKLVKNSIELDKTTKKQINSLKSVNKETTNAIQNIGGIFDEKRADIEKRCEYAVTSIQNVIIAMNKEIEKLTAFTNMAQAKNFDLQNISETIVDKVGDMSNKLALKTEDLKGKAVEVIDRFNEAHDIICSSADRINTSSGLIVNNGKEGVKLMEEQNFYVNNTISNLDLIKDKLDKLRDDIKKSSEEVTSTLENYEHQIEKVKQAKDTQFGIDAPKQEFDRNQILGTIAGINKILQKQDINCDKFFVGIDVFDLWDKYLAGDNGAFLNVLANKITKRQTLSIRKSFDDNAEFHNRVINYLFLMDMLIKELLSTNNRNELLNFTVRNSLDKVYFILVKALNSAE